MAGQLHVFGANGVRWERGGGGGEWACAYMQASLSCRLLLPVPVSVLVSGASLLLAAKFLDVERSQIRKLIQVRMCVRTHTHTTWNDSLLHAPHIFILFNIQYTLTEYML